MADVGLRFRVRPTGAFARSAFGLLTLAAASLPASGAWAQATASVQVVPVIAPTGLLTEEQREREEDNRPPREYTLGWTVTNPGGRPYRISFERDDITSSPQALVPTLGVVGPEGSAGGTTSVIVSEQDLLDYISENEATLGREGELTIFALVFTADETPGEDSDVARGTWTFQYDFEPPEPPPVRRISPGERSIEIGWDRPGSGAEDLALYEIPYCSSLSDESVRLFGTPVNDPNLQVQTSTLVYSMMTLPCSGSAVRTRESIQETETDISITDGIREGRWIAFAVLSQDESPFFNLSTTSTVYAVRSELATDFFELQDTEDGGFCFIATAAYGSYAHPVVAVLRAFRDRILRNLPNGPELIETYYEVSPPLARIIQATPLLASRTRQALVLFLAFMVLTPMVLLGWVTRWLYVRCRSLGRWGLAGLVPCCLAVSPSEATAQLRPEPKGDVGVAFEFKAGPFLPELANDVQDGGLPAWDDIYGGGRTRVLVNVGLDIQLVRSDIGTISVGGTAGFIAWEGRALVTSADNTRLVPGPDGSSTFNLVPMTLTLGYRFDLLLDRTSVPLAPYVRGGLAYYLWWNTRDDGSLSRIQDGNEEREAIGGRPGLVGTVGIALALNAIDRTAAAQFHATTGIRTSYLFFEGQAGWVDGFGDSGFDLSEVTWFGGLMLEL